MTIIRQVDIANNGEVISASSTTTPLNAGATFTASAWTDVSNYASVVLAVYTDQQSTAYAEFSPDGVNVDSSLAVVVFASSNEVHRYTVTRKYFRTRITNNSASNQTILRMQAMRGPQSQLTSAANSVIQDDADALLIRPLDFNLIVSQGLYQNRRTTLKDGINTDVDTGTVPEDIWGGAGVYTGFPTGAPEAGQVIVAGADTGTVYYSYMASNTDTDYTLGSVAVAGAGTYALGHNIFRGNYAYFDSGAGGAVNVGDITVRNTPTTTNVFCIISATQGQSFCAAYTVPFNATSYIDRLVGNIRGGTTTSADAFMWWRRSGSSPVLRIGFTLNFGTLYFDDIDYLIQIPALTDLVPRVTYVSANNSNVQVGYRLITIKG